MDSPVNEPHDAEKQEEYAERNKQLGNEVFEYIKEHSLAVPFVTIDLTFFYTDQKSPCLVSSTGVTVAFLHTIFQRALNTMAPELIPPHVLELTDELEKFVTHNKSVAQ